MSPLIMILKKSQIPVAMAAVLLMVLFFVLPYIAYGAEQEIVKDNEEQSILADVITLPDDGRVHIAKGQRWQYQSSTPTSGPHAPRPLKPGFYKDEQWPEKLVHSLEHGNIVIYYDEPGSEVLVELKKFVKQYRRSAGVIVTPSPGLGEAIILTAWNKLLRMESYKGEKTVAFIKAFGGKGPE